ncbi:MAG: DUF2092 domain-containing protein, partial [Pseudomonadota bacterium]|nr:DUF2092 domain-containing protein [Pseudomonadota bacterium]
MRDLRGIVAGALLLIPPALSAESAPPRVVDPEADRIMERACEQLKSAPAFSVEADISYDDVLTSGLTVQYQRMNQLVLDRPHHLRVDGESDKGQRTLLYDGKTLTVFDPDVNMYVQVPAPDSIDATLDKLEEYGVSLPLDDLMSSEPCAWLHEGVWDGFYAGRHYLDGVYVHHLLFRVPEADFQIWVQGGEVPVIRKVIIEYREKEGAPRYEARLSDWNFRPTIKEGEFA